MLLRGTHTAGTLGLKGSGTRVRGGGPLASLLRSPQESEPSPVPFGML